MSVTPPVRPRLSRLPFHDPEMTWERFEQFCLDYLSCRSDVRQAHFYGTRGSKQDGIDIYADMTNGERWAFQCRHWKRIAKTDVQKAVRDATFPAAHYVILLTSDATTSARQECDQHSGWDIWDGRQG